MVPPNFLQSFPPQNQKKISDENPQECREKDMNLRYLGNSCDLGSALFKSLAVCDFPQDISHCCMWGGWGSQVKVCFCSFCILFCQFFSVYLFLLLLLPIYSFFLPFLPLLKKHFSEKTGGYRWRGPFCEQIPTLSRPVSNWSPSSKSDSLSPTLLTKKKSLPRKPSSPC